MNPQISHTEAGQLPLAFAPSIQQRFEAFHQAHPEVYAYLVARCYQLRREGVERFGIRTLWELCRWNFRRRREADEQYRWNDHFPSRFARIIMAEHPDLADFFETRSLRA